MKKVFSKALGILWPLSGLAMIIFGIVSVFNGGNVVGTISDLLGFAALISGIISLGVRLVGKRAFGSDGKWLSVDSVLLIALGIILINTRLLESLGSIVFVVIGIIIIYNSVQSLIAAAASKSRDDGWFIPRIVMGIILLCVGIWVLFNSRRLFNDISGLIVGIYFISHGVTSINDWIGRIKYNKNFAYLDD